MTVEAAFPAAPLERNARVVTALAALVAVLTPMAPRVAARVAGVQAVRVPEDPEAFCRAVPARSGTRRRS